MKRTVLTLLLVALVYPCLSQTFPDTKKRHNKLSERFKITPESTAKQAKPDNLWEYGAIAIRNNAQADSMLVDVMDEKSDYWNRYRKEVPVYHGASAFIDELVLWHYDGSSYVTDMMYKVSYDDQGMIQRMETYVYDNGAWRPINAEEMLYDYLGVEVFYAYYYYDEGAGEWVMSYAYRASDTHNDNGVLVERIWEYFYYDTWEPEYKEEYKLNENDVIVEAFEYFYDDEHEIWEYEYRFVYELCENNMWEHGYGYFWDWEDEVWFPESKNTDFEWFDFSRQLLTQVTVLMNKDLVDDDYYASKNHDEIDWVKYARMQMDYTDDGLITLMIFEFWGDWDDDDWDDDEWKEEWFPFMKLELAYDHFSNVVYESFSMHDGFDWFILFAQKLDVTYRDDNSIASFTNYIMWDDWKGDFMPVMRYTYYYNDEDDTTDSPLVEAPYITLKAFPNPADSFIQLELPALNGSAGIELMGVDGRILARYTTSGLTVGEVFSMDVSGLKTGMYLIRVQDSGNHYVTRFIKR